MTITTLAQNKITVSFTDSAVKVELNTNKVAFPNFTPGNHHPDASLVFKRIKTKTYEAKLPLFKRGFGSGQIDNIIIYHLSSGPVGQNLTKKLIVKVNIPKGKALIWHGKIWTKETAEVKFHSYFVAREFPLILINQGNYTARYSKFNQIDSMLVVYCWTDNLGKTKLNEAYQAVDTAATIVGQIAPSYWHKFIQNYDKTNYTLTYIINNNVITGLEHYNAPYSITVPNYINEDGIIHTLLHSLIGKAIIPKEYLKNDGKYHPAETLWFYEGLATFLSMKYIRYNFPAFLSAQLYKAKLQQNCNNLELIGLCDKYETYYAKGYLDWLYLQENGLNVELFVKWYYSIQLINKKFPVPISFNDIIHWLTVFNEKIGRLAAETYQGTYLNEAFDILKINGWQPIPLSSVPSWDDKYIGPYPISGISEKQPMLPIDNYPVLAFGVYPKFLFSNGQKFEITSTAAQQIIKQNPEKLLKVEFSNGIIITLADKLEFSDGSPYFMHGTIDYNKNPAFWRRLNNYLK
ncbi:MAG: hypothetical protein HY973_01450 [Candidatus Kerfeldbacteria bacterium]|nr:hypothetical protein [Candidatus Kerfeldbacteria bacterium]